MSDIPYSVVNGQVLCNGNSREFLAELYAKENWYGIIPLHEIMDNHQPLNTFSQFGEDGIIKTIFSVIGVKYKACFEFGAADGEFFSNTRLLVDAGWKRCLIEANPELAKLMFQKFSRANAVCAYVTEQFGVDSWMIDHFGQRDFDLGVIDTDGDDLGHFRRMVNIRPRVLIVECAGAENTSVFTNGSDKHCYYNGISFSGNMSESKEFQIGAKKHFLETNKNAFEYFVKLGEEKGYTPVARNHCNIVFIANEEL